MGTRTTIDIEECCRIAAVQYNQVYSYDKDDDDEDSPFLMIVRKGDHFWIDTNFREGWIDDAAPLLNLFERLHEDMAKLLRATREWTEMKTKAGECEFLCDQSEAVFTCGKYVVKMKPHLDLGRQVITAAVEDTQTNTKTLHELCGELTAETAGTAIKLHIVEVNAKEQS